MARAAGRLIGRSAGAGDAPCTPAAASAGKSQPQGDPSPARAARQPVPQSALDTSPPRTRSTCTFCCTDSRVPPTEAPQRTRKQRSARRHQGSAGGHSIAHWRLDEQASKSYSEKTMTYIPDSVCKLWKAHLGASAPHVADGNPLVEELGVEEPQQQVCTPRCEPLLGAAFHFLPMPLCGACRTGQLTRRRAGAAGRR